MDTEQAPQPKAELINVAKVTEPKQSERTDLKSAPDVGEKGNLVQHEGDLNMNKMGTNQPEQVPNQQPPQPLPQNQLKVVTDEITVTIDSKDNPLAQLQAAKSAYIDQYYRVSDLFICCPLHYRYHISLDFGKNQAYHLFDTKEFSPVCSHNCCPN